MSIRMIRNIELQDGKFNYGTLIIEISRSNFLEVVNKIIPI